jgi:hypothetical protein
MLIVYSKCFCCVRDTRLALVSTVNNACKGFIRMHLSALVIFTEGAVLLIEGQA